MDPGTLKLERSLPFKDPAKEVSAEDGARCKVGTVLARYCCISAGLLGAPRIDSGGEVEAMPDLASRRRLTSQYTKPIRAAVPRVPPTMAPMMTLSELFEEASDAGVLADGSVTTGGGASVKVDEVVVVILVLVEVWVGIAVDSTVVFALSLAAVTLKLPFVWTSR